MNTAKNNIEILLQTRKEIGLEVNIDKTNVVLQLGIDRGG
jgi:hypothetical protein